MPRFLIDPNSGVPAFRQLIEQIRLQIASGRLAPGDEIPSTRALSQELGLNPMTVSKAYGLLEKDRLIERRPGLPHVVRSQSSDATEKEKTALLESALAPAVRAAAQLGLSPTKAAALYKQLLTDASADED